jgi:hypothetical protein
MITSNGQIVIDLGSGLFTYIIVIALGIAGWRKGFRWMLSVALFGTIGYLLTVRSGDFIVALLNRLFSNLPRFGAFLAGQEPAVVAPLDPLIPTTFEAPLLFRVLVFAALLAVGIGFAWPWEKPLKPGEKARPMRLLGAALGLYVGVLSVSALAVFWAASGQAIDLPDLLAAALNGLPNLVDVVPALIGAFLVLLVIMTLLQLPRIWKP